MAPPSKIEEMTTMRFLSLLLSLLANAVTAFQPATHVLLSVNVEAARKAASSFDPKALEFPSINVPTVDLDALKTLTVDVPQIDTTSLLRVDESFLLPVAGIAGVFVILGALQKSAGPKTKVVSSKQKKKVALLAIPYDAAARLAYDQWLSENEEEEYNDEGYRVFREQYEKMAVAMVTYKKLERDLQLFENKAPTPPPPRRIVSVKKKSNLKKDSPFFFADE